jgi:hypothetical protein
MLQINGMAICNGSSIPPAHLKTKAKESMKNKKHTSGDWTIFILVHLILTAGIIAGAFRVYGVTLAFWSGASALIAGLVATYLYMRQVKGATAMKILVYLCAALCAGYMVHNGARALGVTAFNDAQIKKYEIGMAQAAQSQSRKIAKEIGMSTKDASAVEKLFDNEVAVIASILAFLEIGMALICLAIASHLPEQEAQDTGPEIAGDTVYASHDAGQTWQQAAPPAPRWTAPARTAQPTQQNGINFPKD